MLLFNSSEEMKRKNKTRELLRERGKSRYLQTTRAKLPSHAHNRLQFYLLWLQWRCNCPDWYQAAGFCGATSSALTHLKFIVYLFFFFFFYPSLVRGNLLASPSGMTVGRPCPVFHQLADLMNKLSLFKASLYLASCETKGNPFKGILC